MLETQAIPVGDPPSLFARSCLMARTSRLLEPRTSDAALRFQDGSRPPESRRATRLSADSSSGRDVHGRLGTDRTDELIGSEQTDVLGARLFAALIDDIRPAAVPVDRDRRSQPRQLDDQSVAVATQQ